VDVRIVLELCVFVLFLAAWLIYEAYHGRRCRLRPETTRYGRLRVTRERWIEAMVARDEPLLLIHTLRTVTKQTVFLGSVSILAVGGTFGLLLSAEEFQALGQATQVFGHPSPLLLQLKLLLLGAVVAYGFLSFVWGIRALLAAHWFTADPEGNRDLLISGLRHYFHNFQMNTRHGLRAAYYGVDLMVWLFSTELFIVTTVALTISLVRYDFFYHEEGLSYVASGHWAASGPDSPGPTG